MSNGKKRKSKLAEQAERTRARLIEATLELLPQYGFHKVSLDMIAARVGMTKGAIYGSFPNKYALIMEALGTRPDLRPDRIEWPADRSGTPRERMRRLGRAVLASLETSSDLAPVSTELMLHILRDDSAKERRSEVGVHMRSEIEKNTLALFDSDELTMPVASFALLLSLVAPSLMFARAFEGHVVTDEVILGMLEGCAVPSED